MSDKVWKRSLIISTAQVAKELSCPVNLDIDNDPEVIVFAQGRRTVRCFFSRLDAGNHQMYPDKLLRLISPLLDR